MAAFRKASEVVLAKPKEERTVTEWLFLGQAHYRTNEYDKARAALEMVIALNGECH